MASSYTGSTAFSRSSNTPASAGKGSSWSRDVFSTPIPLTLMEIITLTKQGTPLSQAQTGQQITPEMRQAGAAIIQEYRDVFDSEVLAERIYTAMVLILDRPQACDQYCPGQQ